MSGLKVVLRVVGEGRACEVVGSDATGGGFMRSCGLVRQGSHFG